MNPRDQSGFVLPLALLLSSGLLVMAVLAWQWEIDAAPRDGARQLHERARSSLLVNLPAILRHLEEQVLWEPSTSAMIIEPGLDVERPVSINPVSGEQLPLYSTHPDDSDASVVFPSPISDARLVAHPIPLAQPPVGKKQALAWAAEDLNIMPPEGPPPDFWPLPAWNLSPAETEMPIEAFLDEATRGNWQTLPWIPASEPLPMLEESSPALVPVVRSLGLRFGIFAAGSARSREKTVRVRFFLEGEFWNPYNRPLVTHPGSGLRSVVRILFWNLPEIRLHNRSIGLSSNWIALDNARNSRSGKSGLQGYVRLPGTFQAGESISFLEPDPSRQAQGLARTLHPGFRVRPADRIEIEIRQPPGGLHAACLSMNSADPLDSALAGQGWFRAEGFPAEWPVLRFDRADAGRRPFLLEKGSLSFRLTNAHLRVVFTNSAAEVPWLRDPRRSRVVFNESLQAPSGAWSTGGDLLDLRVEQLDSPPEAASPQPPAALFSWPSSQPRSVVESMDLPQWTEGFRLGSAGAPVINSLLNDPLVPLGRLFNEEPERLHPMDESPLDYRPAFPVNQLSEARWMERLRQSAEVTGPETLRFPVQVYPESDRPADFRSWPATELRPAIGKWVASIGLAPLKSPASLFDSGLLTEHIRQDPRGDPLHPFLPLRGLLKNGPLPRAHGSAWILHLASKASRDSQSRWASARVWLLETRPPGGQPRFEPIRFEWTDPEELQRPTPR